MIATDFYPFGITFEGGQLPVPPQLKDRKDIKWSETSLISHDMLAEFQCEEDEWVELLITEHGKIYKQIDTQELIKSEDQDSVEGFKAKILGTRLELVEDFTGVIRCSYFITTKEEDGSDYQVDWKAVFIHGDLDIVEVEKVRNSDPSVRKASMEALKSIVTDFNLVKNREESPAFTYLYRPYRFILRGGFLLIAFIWQLPILGLQWVISKLTPR